MNFTADQIAGLLKGKVEGDGGVLVNSLSKIEEGKPGTLTFLANLKYASYLYETDASIVILNKDFTLDRPVKVSCTLIRVEDAYRSFASLLELYDVSKIEKKGIEIPSFIDPTAKLGKDIYIGAFAYISKNVVLEDGVQIYPQVYIGENVKIGKGTILFPGVKIYHDCQVGIKCTLHAGSVVGSDGFGFAPNTEREYKKVPQLGNVVLEDFVEIGANTTIDRATLGATRIGRGSKLDNLVQIAHNVEIGENSVLAGGSFVAGSTKVGKNLMMGGQSGIIGHLVLGDNIKIAGQSGVGSNLEDGAIVQGSPAFSVGEFQRSYVLFRSLTKLRNQINEMEKKLKDEN